MEATNGYANGYSKGTKMNGINGHAVGTKRTSSAARGPTILTRLFSIIARYDLPGPSRLVEDIK